MWPSPATAQASELASNWVLFTAVGLAVAVLVWGLIIFAALRWRRRDDELPPQFNNNAPLEIAWTIVPLALVCLLFVYTYRAEADVEALSSDPAVTLHVNAHRWGWSFAYVGGPVVEGATDAPVLGSPAGKPPELELPAGETTRIELTSSDVTHSFWVPAFLFKRDAIPGQTTAFDLRPDRLGVFAGRCAQFCGLDHALMTFSVRVVPAAEFERWRRQAAAAR
jgi:cytochrome c oxidase subunit II